MEVICKSENDAIELMRRFTLWSSKVGILRDGRKLMPAYGSDFAFNNYFSNLAVNAPGIKLEKGLEE